MPRGHILNSRSTLSLGRRDRLSIFDRPYGGSPTVSGPESVFMFNALKQLFATIWDFAQRSFHSPLRSRSPRFDHLDETQMLAHLDGELSDQARQQTADHLRSCWTCRGRFRELCSSVEAYVLSRESQLPDPSSDSDRRIGELRRRLAEVMRRDSITSLR